MAGGSCSASGVGNSESEAFWSEFIGSLQERGLTGVKLVISDVHQGLTNAIRKKVLIEHGFRLPSAADNRPLKGEEFLEKARQTVFVSATPGNWEMEAGLPKSMNQVVAPAIVTPLSASIPLMS
jgi:hypothetical protein